MKTYLDYAATTPVDKRVIKAMIPYLVENFGNTMSLHSFGQQAKLSVENSRAVLASMINSKPNEIIFTSSATESNNTALKGVAFTKKSGHIIISSIEHPCILESANWLEKRGWEITKLPVDKFGMVSPDDVKKSIKENTILVSVIHASNEIGTIQPVSDIGKICRDAGVYFHTDASQSFGKEPIDVEKMNIDLLTASSHKIYGPKGVGLLYIRNGLKIEPLLHGGGQENGMRGSTVNVAGIVGFAKAGEISKKEMKKENKRLTLLRNKLIKEVLEIHPHTKKTQGVNNSVRGSSVFSGVGVKNSRLNGHPTKRLANNANFSFDFIEGESLLMQLDMEGIACSTGSACSSFKLEPSHVLLATGLKPEEAHGSLRISLGRWTTKNDIEKIIKVLPKIINKIRAISPFK
jgi:cysteine desulfurase